jgi:hypothetical protein
MPRLDATGNLATRTKVVKGEGRKIIFASEIAGVKLEGEAEATSTEWS